jgi:hypothetical protein
LPALATALAATPASAVAPPPAPAPGGPAPATAAYEIEPEPRARRSVLLRLWGACVILVGLLFIAATLYLAIGLRDYTHLGVIPAALGVTVGLVAAWIGVALTRSGA